MASVAKWLRQRFVVPPSRGFDSRRSPFELMLILSEYPTQLRGVKLVLASEEAAMTQAKVRFASFEEYLLWSDDPENFTEGRYELIDGELVQLMSESEPNLAIAKFLFVFLMNAGISLRLIYLGGVEVQVPVLQTGDAATRYPDLVVLREEHIPLLAKRATITLDMPPPPFILEVASPGRQNQERDYNRKLAQYQEIGVEEYWIADPSQGMVTVFKLEPEGYVKVGEFRDDAAVPCSTYPTLALRAEQILNVG
jgi:Uma2 family endonuclease